MVRKTFYSAQLSWQPVAILVILALIWGANMAIIKLGARQLPPLFMAGLRSLVAGGCLLAWMKLKAVPVFPSKALCLHGIVVGSLFGAEFGCIYVGLEHTLASRTYIFVYTAPFFAALGAHIFLKGDKLNFWKIGGLLLAFGGVVLLFAHDMGRGADKMLFGDGMAMVGGLLWASTTLYLKKFLADRSLPLQTLFYQVFFSAPLLLAASFFWEHIQWQNPTWLTAFSIFYQGIVVAFLSYLAWFELIHRYPVSLLHGFSFFTPVFGVLLSGILILGEPIPFTAFVSLALVSVGMVFVNKRPAEK